MTESTSPEHLDVLVERSSLSLGSAALLMIAVAATPIPVTEAPEFDPFALATADTAGTSASMDVASAPSAAEIVERLQAIHHDLVCNAVALPPEAQRILNESAWDLYET